MKTENPQIVIENVRGSYKKFAESLDEFPILGVTFPTHYGYIKGYVSEDMHDLDVFLGNGNLHGYLKILRDDVAQGHIETKVFTHVSLDELKKIELAYAPVLKKTVRLTDEKAFLDFISAYKDPRP